MYANVKGQLPGPLSKKYMEESAKYESGTTSQQAPIVWDSAQGVIITDVDGNKFIDLTSGVLVTNVGHCHPKLTAAIQRAAGRLMNCYDFPTPERGTLAKRLVEATPENLDRCFFTVTGSEATDSALRVVRRATGRHEILSFYGGFHGRSYGPMSVAGKTGTKRKFGPVVPGSILAPYPYCFRCPFKKKPESCGMFCLEFLDRVVEAQSTGDIAALIIEPYQGSSGFIFPPDGFLKKLEQWAKERDIIFILDEVQASFGRTGKLFALEWEGLRPNVLCLGKGIGSSVPAAAMLTETRLISALGPGEMSSTYGGNPVSSAAGLAVLDIIAEEKLPENALKVGAYMKERLQKVQEKSQILGDVRGRGLVIGLEIVKDRESIEPAPDITMEIIRRAAQEGVIMGRVAGNVIRVAPPLVITMEQAEEAVDILERVFAQF
jgi:4-aminobutyrate aminotransferase-like enzyme